MHSWILKRLASAEDYAHFEQEALDKLQSKFPQVSLRPFSEFKSFLDSWIPKLIHKYMLLSMTMKVCSGISPDFAELASNAGFPTLTMLKPGHMTNLVLTSEGPYEVDLSAIQFSCEYDFSNASDPDRLEAAKEAFKKLYKNPSKAVDVGRIAKEYYVNVRFPHGVYDSLYNPIKSLERYSPEETEKVFPDRFELYK